MASASDLAVLLGEAAQIYYTGKAFEYQQIKDRQSQTNIEIDRRLSAERDEKVLTAEVYKSQLTRLTRQTDALHTQVLAQKQKYTNLTNLVFDLSEIDKTESAPQVIGDIQEGSLAYLAAEIQAVEDQKRSLLTELSTVASRVNAIDQMQIDMRGGAGGPAVGPEDKLDTTYDPTDFSYSEYLDRSGTEGTEWLQAGYIMPTPKELMDLNKAAIDLQKNKAMSKIYSSRTGFDQAKNYHDVDAYLKGHYGMTLNDEGIGPLTTYQTIAGSEIGKDPINRSEDYYVAMEDIVGEKLRLAGKFDPLAFEEAFVQNFAGMKWAGTDTNYTKQDYEKYVMGDKGFMDSLHKKSVTAGSDFVMRAEALKTWTEGTYTVGFTALKKMRGQQGLTIGQGTGEDMLVLIDKRRAQYEKLIQTGDEDMAVKLAAKFRMVSGIDISKVSEIEGFREVVSREGWVGIEDKDVAGLISGEVLEGEQFASSSDYVYLKMVHDAHLQDPNDLETYEDYQLLLSAAGKKWGRAELTASVGDWIK